MSELTPNQSLYNLPFRTDSFHGMPYRYLGKSGFSVSNIGLGTWKFGRPETGDGSRVDEKTAYDLFDLALDLGVTFWDTANRYNNASGNSERLIGHWLKRNGQERRNIVIATKVAGTMDGLTPNHGGLSRGSILDAVYASLERLQLDRIDLLYFHAFDPNTPPEESLTAVEDLVRQDLVRYFAVSNFNVQQLLVYQQCRNATSIRSSIIAVQNQFDLLNGEAPGYAGVLGQATSAHYSFIAWSPLAKGWLTDKYLDLAKVGPGDRLFDEGTIHQSIHEGKMAKLHRLASIAHQWDMALNELVVAYMLSTPGMGPVIPSVSNAQQLKSHAKAGKITLTAEQISAVEDIL